LQTSTKKRGRPRKNDEHALAASAITAEDLAFESALQATEATEPDIEPSPNTTLKKEKVNLNLLADHIEDYAPAKTHTDLLEQVHMAKQVGADSIEADPKIIRQLTLKSGYPDDVGYFWFHDVKVWIPGFYETHSEKDKESIETRLFGKSKVGIRPIMDLGEKPK
jgi:hypothetical protein